MLLPRRGARTHDKISFDDLMAEAFGEMGMSPKEFITYSYSDYMHKRKGFSNSKIERLQEVRLICFFAAAGNLRKGTKIEDLFPLPGDKNYNQKSRKMDPDMYKRAKEMLSKITIPDLPIKKNGRTT